MDSQFFSPSSRPQLESDCRSGSAVCDLLAACVLTGVAHKCPDPPRGISTSLFILPKERKRQEVDTFCHMSEKTEMEHSCRPEGGLASPLCLAFLSPLKGPNNQTQLAIHQFSRRSPEIRSDLQTI